MAGSANDLMARTLDYVATSSAASEKMASEINTHRDVAEKRAAAVPEVLSALLDSGCVPADQEKQAQEILDCPVATLGFLKQAALKIKEQAAELDKLAEEKTASVRELGSGVGDEAGSSDFDVRDTPFIGGYSSEKKASDRAFEAGILGDPARR